MGVYTVYTVNSFFIWPHGLALWQWGRLIRTQLPFHAPAGTAKSAWFLRGVPYRVSIQMKYVGWRDTIEDRSYMCNPCSLSGETLSPAPGRSETCSNQGLPARPCMRGAYITTCCHHRWCVLSENEYPRQLPLWWSVSGGRDSLSTQRTFCYLVSTLYAYSSWTCKIDTFVSFSRYECFKQENTISLFPIALLLIFSISVSVVSIHFHYNSDHWLAMRFTHNIRRIPLFFLLYLFFQVYLQWKEPVFHQVRECVMLTLLRLLIVCY